MIPAAATTAATTAAATTADVLTRMQAVDGRSLDFQFDDFIPLFVSPVPFRDGEKFAQSGAGVVQ